MGNTNYHPISSVGWIDFSDNDKQKVLKVIELLREKGTVDELGVGVIRNALSDAMFPCITTIMSRAKYYFIIPRILHNYIFQKPARTTAKQYLRAKENELMQLLAEQNNFEDNTGVIGMTVARQNRDLPPHKWGELLRKPSTIYWNGLRSLHIYKGDLSLGNLLNEIDKKAEPNNAYTYIPAEGETSNDRDAEHKDSPFSLPDYSLKWEEELSIELTPAEADFLKHRIIDAFPSSFLASIVQNKKFTKDFLKAKNYVEMCEMPFVKQLSPETRNIIYTARDFWQIMYGAHIRFNILLHKKYGNAAYKKECEELWNGWKKEMKKFKWKQFNQELMWQVTKEHSYVKSFTERFVKKWIALISSGKYGTQQLDLLVEQQETDNKKTRSKLRVGNDERYKDWVGIGDMDFRFKNAGIIINDIARKL